jgi:hypothetical protein
VARDLLLGRISTCYSRDQVGSCRASESLLAASTLALLLVPLAGRLTERLTKTSYERGLRPTLEMKIPPTRELVSSLSRTDLDYQPRMYRGDARVTREIPASVVAESLKRVYAARRASR